MAAAAAKEKNSRRFMIAASRKTASACTAAALRLHNLPGPAQGDEAALAPNGDGVPSAPRAPYPEAHREAMRLEGCCAK